MLCLALCLPCFPALAEQSYTVYIGGASLTVLDNGAPAYLKNDGVPGTADNYNAKLWYDAAEGSLTLEISGLVARGSADYSYATTATPIQPDQNRAQPCTARFRWC